jgi:hypothetical protein
VAITTLSQAVDGMLPPIEVVKQPPTISTLDMTWNTSWYNTGYPTPASTSLSGTLAGTALTSATGQMPFTNPAAGNTYLAAVRRTSNSPPTSLASQGSFFIIDRLWESSGTAAVLTPQTVNSVTWPTRDINGSSLGEGVFVALEIYNPSTLGGTLPTASISYTNSAGVSGRAGVMMANDFVTTVRHFAIYPFSLDSGDTGVQSIQTLTYLTDANSRLRLIAFRPICIVPPFNQKGARTAGDIITLAAPRLFDNSVLQTLFLFAGYSFGFQGGDSGATTIQYTQG